MPIEIDRQLAQHLRENTLVDPKEFILKVSKNQAGAGANIVVEKRSLKTLFGKYIYSGSHTYDLSQVRSALTQALHTKTDQQQTPSPLSGRNIVELCCTIFNEEVEEELQSIWTRITHFCARMIGFLPFSIQKIVIPPPKSAVANNIPASPLSLTQIQQTAFSDIGYTSLLLEHYQKQKQSPLDEADICQGFDILDDSIGETWKGICTPRYFNTLILGVDEHDDDPLCFKVHTHIEAIKDILETNPRGLVFFRKSDGALFAFKLNNQGEVLMHQKDANNPASWTVCTNAMLKELNIQPDDLCISLGEDFPTAVGFKTYHLTQTPQNTRSADGYFYHEEQGEDSASLCAIHAANQYLGYPAIDVASFFSFARQLIINQLNLSPEALYQMGTNVGDIRKGTDPAILIAFLHHLAQTQKIPSSYTHFHIANIKSKKIWNDDAFPHSDACNRAIIGYGGFHFATLRKDENNQQWYLIDSMHEDSQFIAYPSLEEAVKKSPVANVPDSISLIY